jgi:prepilin-type processing-associated H-X9-DG protein
MNGDQKSFWCPETDPQFQWKPMQPFGKSLTKATSAHTGYGYDVGEYVLNVDQCQFSYGYNDWGSQNPSGTLDAVGLGGDCWKGNSFNDKGREPNASRVARSADCIVLTDVIAKTPAAGSWLMNVDPKDPSQAPSNRHSGGCNVLFCDGHAAWKLQADICLFDPKTGAAKAGYDYTRTAQLWNIDNQSH